VCVFVCVGVCVFVCVCVGVCVLVCVCIHTYVSAPYSALEVVEQSGEKPSANAPGRLHCELA